MPGNEWFEYDVTDEQGNTYTHTAESADTAAAIQSLLDMQANSAGQKPKVTVQRLGITVILLFLFSSV